MNWPVFVEIRVVMNWLKLWIFSVICFSSGQEVQRLSVLSSLPELLAENYDMCVRRIIPKIRVSCSVYKFGIQFTNIGFSLQVSDSVYKFGIQFTSMGFSLQVWDSFYKYGIQFTSLEFSLQVLGFRLQVWDSVYKYGIQFTNMGFSL